MPQQQAVLPGQTHLQIPLRPRAPELQAAARGQRGERDGMLPFHGMSRGDEFLVLRRLDAQRVGLVGFCTSSASSGRPQQRTSAPPDDTVSPPQGGQTYHFAFFMFPPSSAPPGSSPIVGYHYGAQNHAEVKNVLKRSLTMLASAARALTAIAIIGAKVLSSIFVGYDAALLDMTTRAFRFCAVPFLIMWFNMYTSCFFTELNDGAVSAAISFMRSLVLPLTCVIVMPAI